MLIKFLVVSSIWLVILSPDNDLLRQFSRKLAKDDEVSEVNVGRSVVSITADPILDEWGSYLFIDPGAAWVLGVYCKLIGLIKFISAGRYCPDDPMGLLLDLIGVFNCW